MLTNKLLIVSVATAAVAGLSIAPGSAYERPGRTAQVDVTSDGRRAPGCDGAPACQNATSQAEVGHDGRYVAVGTITRMSKADTNGVSDIYVRDMTTGKVVRVSVSSAGGQAIGLPRDGLFVSGNPKISGNGRFVAFTSEAPNLISGDTNLHSDVFVHDLRTRLTTRVSVNSRGQQTLPGEFCCGATEPAISHSGRYVVFSSSAFDLVANDETGCLIDAGVDRFFCGSNDIFMHDRRTGKTSMISMSSREVRSNHASFDPFISPNGRYVGFTSLATNLVDDDTNLVGDAFVRDRKTGRTHRVSVASDGTQGISTTLPPNPVEFGAIVTGVSNDGDVSFWSRFNNLVPHDTTSSDMFVHELRTRRTYRVSLRATGEQMAGSVGSSETGRLLSADGRYVMFSTAAGNLASDDDNGHPDPYIYDRTTGNVELVARNDNGSVSSESPSHLGALSGNGRFALFASAERAFRDPKAKGKDDRVYHLFRRDLGPDLGTGGLAITGALRVAGAQGFASSGVVAATDPTGDVGGTPITSTADIVSASVAYRDHLGDLFVRIGVRDMPWLVDGIGVPRGLKGVVYGLSFSTGDVGHEIRIAWMPSGPVFGLYRCGTGEACSFVRRSPGGFGTAGYEVAASLPLEAVGLAAGGTIRELRAFTGYGAFDVGALVSLDRVDLKG